MRIASYASATALYLKAKYNPDLAESERIANLAAVRVCRERGWERVSGGWTGKRVRDL
jgi:hypothetical protein